jgi:putative intracellular protease/amidase
MSRTIGALIFPGFELLDMFGPLEMFGMLEDAPAIKMIAESLEPVPSRQGPRSVVDATLADATAYDILLVPGGPGTRTEVANAKLLAWLGEAADASALVTTVCTGSALLARTGRLDGKAATSNKAAFAWVTEQGPAVDWRPEARWVEDGKFMTSSGVSAGMDMALAAIQRLYGAEEAERVATRTEYDWKRDPSWDPFARVHGLV